MQRTRIDVFYLFKFRRLRLDFLDASSHSRYMMELTVMALPLTGNLNCEPDFYWSEADHMISFKKNDDKEMDTNEIS